MPTLRYIFFILLVTLVSLFAVKNMHTVEVHFFDVFFNDYTIQVPTMMVVLSSFGLGFLVAWFFELFNRIKFKTQVHMRERKIESLQEELQHLRPPPELPPQSEGSTPVSNS